MMIDQSWYERPPDVPESISAGGIVVREEPGKIYVALVLEGQQMKYVLPKGHQEPGETLEEAARREIEEESGIQSLELIMELGERPRLDLFKKSWKRIYYFLFKTTQITGTPTDTRRSYQLHWFLLDEIPPMFWPEQRELIQDSVDKIKQAFL